MATFCRSYSLIQRCDFMSSFRTNAPASMLVCSSSPERSRKPVLTNTSRSRAAAMQAARLTDVRRSSSITPILTVFGA